MPDEPARRVTYAAAGVDIDARDATARRFGEIARGTHGPRVLHGGGGFAGLFHLGDRYRDPVLVAATDGVGTKVLLATVMDRYEAMGRDVVHNNVNDLITTGAAPLFFLDYFATSELADEYRVRVVQGIADACAAMEVALIGGETADMPDIYRRGDFDLAGFAVGAVERDAILDGAAIAPGDALIALPSSGLHTNGYSLVREIWGLGKGLGEAHDREVLETTYEELGGASLGEALLAVHEPYWPLLSPVMSQVKGLAHITGGGIPGNLPRILGDAVAARIDIESWEPPALFRLVQRHGDVDEAELFRTLNMGVGMIAVVAPEYTDATLAALPGAWVIGAIEPRGSAGGTATGAAVRGIPGTE